MVRFLFWNTRGNRVEHALAEIVREHRVDLVLLAEDKMPLRNLLLTLNQNNTSPFLHTPTRIEVPRPITFFSRLPVAWLQAVQDYPGIAIRRVTGASGVTINLIVVHLVSKKNYSQGDQVQLSTRLARIVDDVDRNGEKRTIIVGDFNMNPFEAGVVGSEGLHAVMSRAIASQEERTVQDEKRLFFYNPMWSHFGDRPPSPPGTYYYRHTGPIAFFWHMFDQVLLRPGLLPYFEDENLKILTMAGSTSLLTKDGRPDTQISDHLPILFSLKI